MGWKEQFLGEGERYNYGSMCAMTYPCSKAEKKKVNFYTKGKL
jgi:hypothetical protein